MPLDDVPTSSFNFTNTIMISVTYKRLFSARSYSILVIHVLIPLRIDVLQEVNTFAASYLNTQGLNNSCLKSPASTFVDLTFQSRALRSFSLNQLRNLSL